jgi:hypothetical protein
VAVDTPAAEAQTVLGDIELEMAAVGLAPVVWLDSVPAHH